MFLLRKPKKNCFSNLNENDIVDNKLFWKTVKPSFSDKVILRDKINLSENGQISKSELETAGALNNVFSNIIKNLEISKFSDYEPFIYNIEDKTLRASLKYKKHPSIIPIQNQLKTPDTFYFTELEVTSLKKKLIT